MFILRPSSSVFAPSCKILIQLQIIPRLTWFPLDDLQIFPRDAHGQYFLYEGIYIEGSCQSPKKRIDYHRKFFETILSDAFVEYIGT